MAAGDTQIIISAVDRTQAGVASAKSGLDSLKTSFGSLQTVVASLAGVGAVAMFTNWAKDTIAAAAALDDLADATGSSVESLSKLSNIAKVSGASFDTIDGAIKKLAVGMAGVDEESSRAGKALAAIGIQARDPAQALTEIAQKFATYEDGANKAALAVAIFGKSGAALLPILKDIAENVDIAGTVTTQQARRPRTLEKSMAPAFAAGGEALPIALIDIVPALTATIIVVQPGARGRSGLPRLADDDRNGPTRRCANRSARRGGSRPAAAKRRAKESDRQLLFEAERRT
jgi:hypothetical protein